MESLLIDAAAGGGGFLCGSFGMGAYLRVKKKVKKAGPKYYWHIRLFSAEDRKLIIKLECNTASIDFAHIVINRKQSSRPELSFEEAVLQDIHDAMDTCAALNLCQRIAWQSRQGS